MHTTLTLRKLKQQHTPIAMMTAYDAPSAAACAQAEMDLLLVGDSAGMVIHGYTSTVPVTVDDMILHTRAVKRGAPEVFTVTDMPFLSCSGSRSEAVNSVRHTIQDGRADAVKIEGAGEFVPLIAALTEGGVAVMSHLGLTPQSFAVLGGYKVQGKSEESAARLIEDAKQVERAGAFALVLECVPGELAAYITSLLSIPVIGIGAGSQTDGQVLVYHDALGIGSGHVPSFVKTFAELEPAIHTGLADYVKEVKARSFPDASHTFTMPAAILEKVTTGASI